jgi:hypothetical protein
MRLNGVMLEGLELASFCDMRKKSYLAPPCRSVTPPVEKVPSSSSVFIANSTPSSDVWSSWSASPNNIDMGHGPVNSISSTSDPWAVDLQDSIDNIEENSQDIGKFSTEGSKLCLISSQACYLG